MTGKHSGGKPHPGGSKKGTPVWVWLLLLILLLLGGFFAINWFWLHLWGMGQTCDCVGTLNGGVDADFTLTVNDTEIEGAYVGSIEIEYLAFSNELYQLMLAHDFADMDELMTYLNDTYPLNGTVPYTSYVAWSYLEFMDARAIFDYDYDNISINGESFSACITGVALIPYMSIEVFYANGTTYDYFDFALMTAAEIEDIEDLEDPFDLIDHLPDHLVLECGETLTFNVLDVTVDGDDIVVDVTVDGADIACPELSFWPW
jgi:hypothetical protein